ncbi:MAG: glycosyltransferase family 39 protein [Candidatus Gastranaerophilales bacterium]|nr:glycosyltransferase family 39 protein [Candidatus Gastranaerophilales bacterium]
MEKNKENYIIFWGIGLLFLATVNLCFFRYYDHDELEAIHTAWKLLQGQRIYIDFFQQKHPFFHYTVIPFISYFGETIRTITATRIYMFSLYLGTLFASFCVAKEVFSKKAAIFSVFLIMSAPIFVNKAIEIRPDNLQIFLTMVSLALLYSQKNKWTFYLSALFMALACIVLQKACFIAIIVSVFMLYCVLKKELKIKDFICYELVFLSVIAIFMSFIFSGVSFQKYWIFNWFINRNFLDGFSCIKNIKYLIMTAPVFLPLTLVGLAKVSTEKQREIALLTIISFLLIFFITAPNKQYFMPFILFGAILAGNVLSNLFVKNKKLTYFIILFCFGFSIFNYVNMDFKGTNQSQNVLIDYVIKNTSSKDFVYDGDIQFNLYRNDLDYFWFSLRKRGVLDTYKTKYNYSYNVLELINHKKPQIISDKYITQKDMLELSKDYSPVSFFNGIFIRKKK